MKFIVTLFLFAGSFSYAMGSEGFCPDLLTTLASGKDPANSYLSLIRNLALNRNVLSADDLLKLSNQPEWTNPFEFLNLSLEPKEAFAYIQAFSTLLKDRELNSLQCKRLALKFFDFRLRKTLN